MATPEVDMPRIPEFYAGRSIFITGFSGFMGKILVEKLLWSCPDIHRIYVLLRDKKGLNPQQRLDKIINSEPFERLRERNMEEIKSKLVSVSGDTSSPGLGILPEVRSLLCKEVSMIFHGAASVRFDDPLTTAIDINAFGTKSVVDLALEMPKLVAFMHISTAYSNCHIYDIEEKIYPPIAGWEETLKIREKIDPRTFCTLSAKYSNHMPNTYTFSKSIGEQIVNAHADRIPVAVIRPSIVINTVKEPFGGWFDNFNGPAGLMFGYGLGVVRTTLSDDTNKPDFIPVDIVVKGVIVSGCKRACTKEEGIQVYNSSARDRSLTISELVELGKTVCDEVPMKFYLWRPTTHTTSSKFLFYTYFVLFQMLPAFFIDIALRAVGRKPMLWKVQRRLYIAMQALSYFSLNYFHLHHNNILELADSIQEDDRAEFYYKVVKNEVNELKLFCDSARYIQKKFFKMKPEDIRNAKILLQVMTWADRVVKTVFWSYLAYFVYKYEVIQTIANRTIEFLFNF